MSSQNTPPPSYPIWFVVARPDYAGPLYQFGVKSIVACVPANLRDLDALYKQFAEEIFNPALPGSGAVFLFTRFQDGRLPAMLQDPQVELLGPAGQAYEHRTPGTVDYTSDEAWEKKER